MYEIHPIDEAMCPKCRTRYVRRLDQPQPQPFCTTPFCHDDAGEPISLINSDEVAEYEASGC